MELATQVALGINNSEKDLRTNLRFMRVLWKRDYLYEFNGRLTFVTVTHVDSLTCRESRTILFFMADAFV